MPMNLTRAPEGHAEMLVRRPPADVFHAFVDPTLTTRFWFTDSTGPIAPGATLRWEWAMYGAAAAVRVKEVAPGERVVFEWGGPEVFTTVTVRFAPWNEGRATHVIVDETGFPGDGDAVVARAIDSSRGFTIMLCAMKALLEHSIELQVVRDAHPAAHQS